MSISSHPRFCSYTGTCPCMRLSGRSPVLRGLDKTVRCTMSETMKELLRGVGVPDTRMRLYGVGHWGIVMRKSLISYFTVGTYCLTALMCGMHGPDVLYEGTGPPAKRRNRH
jgi:hypothetical protein